MDVVMKIQKRDALLLWTVPYITGHYASMEDIIIKLAEPKEFKEFAEVPFPVAFTVERNGEISFLPPSQWIDFQRRIERLGETDENYTHEQWRYDSVEVIRKQLPVFIWLDEFQRWFDWHVKEESGSDDDQSLTLCFSPTMPKVHTDYFESLVFDLALNSPPLQSEMPAVEGVSLSEGVEISHLLTAPSRQDDWFEAISDMTKAFYAEHGQIPNNVQAWGRLCATPPAGYAITAGKDSGGDNVLRMDGFKPLGRKAFDERWKKYTTKESE